MRLLSSTALLLILVGVALAGPAKRKLEKKSISNSLAPKTVESVDQKLEEPAKLSDEALMEVAGENVDRAKKQAMTRFCVAIVQNKPTRVDCDELNNRPIPPPPPPPAPEPQEPAEPPQPAPPAPVPQQQPEEYKFELPCEPEMVPYYVQQTGQIIYVPTGNCAPHVPALVHVPSGNPLYTVPAGGASGNPLYTVPAGGASGNPLYTVPAGGASGNPLYTVPAGGASGNPLYTVPAGGASGTPSINVLHLSTGSLPSTGHGLGPTMVPVHTAPTHHVIHPSPLHYGLHHGGLPLHGHGGLPLHGHGGLPLHGHGGLHGGHQHLSAVECTCKTTPGAAAKSADGSSPSNEALAMKFIQDIQKNAQTQSAGSPASPTMVQVGPGQPASPMMMMRSPSGEPMMMKSSSGEPMMMSGQPGSPMIMMSPGSGSPAMAGTPEMRHAPYTHVYPMSNVHHQQVIYQHQFGTRGYPTRPYGHMTHGMYPHGMLRSNADCLQDSFSSSAQAMPQGLRLSREEAEASVQVQPEQKAEEKPQEDKPSPSDVIEAMKKQSEENN